MHITSGFMGGASGPNVVSLAIYHEGYHISQFRAGDRRPGNYPINLSGDRINFEREAEAFLNTAVAAPAFGVLPSSVLQLMPDPRKVIR
jgi:hypothetical protein